MKTLYESSLPNQEGRTLHLSDAEFEHLIDQVRPLDIRNENYEMEEEHFELENYVLLISGYKSTLVTHALSATHSNPSEQDCEVEKEITLLKVLEWTDGEEVTLSEEQFNRLEKQVLEVEW